ncbi:MAG: hypothetical protein HY342_05605 [Candidatus Lambdaproteobacteria bacterium]|nr:hypothetical protein [Candidatus Lambdaproteobacteria bacterium]
MQPLTARTVKRAVLALLPVACVAWLAACTGVAELTPVDYERLYDRPAVMAQSTRLEEVPPQVFERFMNRVEAALAASPNVGRLVTRADMARLSVGERLLEQRYRVLSDTLSVVDFGDREISSQLARELNVELVIVAQVVYEPCAHCTEGGLFGAFASILEAGSGELLYRVHISRRTTVTENDRFDELSDEFAAELLSAIDHAIQPKWHRLRFKALSQLARS